MNTAHLFNAMKMCFNHLAVEHGGEPVWHEHVYSNFVYAAETVPHQLAFIVVKMLEELDTRTNLPEEMVQPLALIRNQVENARLEA
jgi:hypothetical protein